MLGRTAPGESAGRSDFGGGAVQNTAVDDRFAVVGGGSLDLAGDILSSGAREPLLALADFGTVTVGDPSDTLLDAMPDASGSLVGSAIENKMESELQRNAPGDATTVAIETKGVLLDPAELQRRIVAVAAVADSFEQVTADARRA